MFYTVKKCGWCIHMDDVIVNYYIDWMYLKGSCLRKMSDDNWMGACKCYIGV